MKLDRGLYTSKEFPATLDPQIVLACKCVPHGIVCLECPRKNLMVDSIFSPKHELL